MSAQTTPLTERQLELITRAHCDAHGLIEPLLELKGGAKLKMIASLAQRGLIEQRERQWRLTPVAIAIVKGEAQAEDVLPPRRTMGVAAPTPDDDPERQAAAMPPAAQDPRLAGDSPLEAEVATESLGQADRPAAAPKRGRANSKQTRVIEMLKRPEGATLAQIGEATGWQAHTIRGFFAGVLRKKLGLTIVSEKLEGSTGTPSAGERCYRIAMEPNEE